MQYYHSEFRRWAKKFILEENLQDLSSQGWREMGEVERALLSKSITIEDAIEKFLDERNFRKELKDKYKINDYLKMFKR